MMIFESVTVSRKASDAEWMGALAAANARLTAKMIEQLNDGVRQPERAPDEQDVIGLLMDYDRRVRVG